MLSYWEKYAKDSGPGGIVDIIMAIGKPSDHTISKSDPLPTGNTGNRSAASGADCYLSADCSIDDSTEQVLGVTVLACTPYVTRRYHTSSEITLVHPKLRSTGMMAELIAAAWSLAYHQGKSKAGFVSQAANRAVAIYEYWGFKKIGEVPEFETSPIDGKSKTVVSWWLDLEAAVRNPSQKELAKQAPRQNTEGANARTRKSKL